MYPPRKQTKTQLDFFLAFGFMCLTKSSTLPPAGWTEDSFCGPKDRHGGEFCLSHGLSLGQFST